MTLGEPILSLRERLHIDPETTGRGVTVAFVDSAFFPHPDLVRPRDRIRAFADMTKDSPTVEDFLQASPHVWHGTMTACCSAGSGHLSQGRYRGIASNADLVLLKVQASENEPIVGESVARALRFVLRHPELGVNVVNISVGVSWDDPDALDVEDAVAELVRSGVVVVAAAGNIDGSPPSPPASSAHAIAVGGVDDRNTLLPGDDARFPSSAGARSSRNPKPDLLAPAVRLPAPMVPGTLTAREAPHLFHLLRLLEEVESDIRFRKGRPLDMSKREEASLFRTLEAIQQRIVDQKFISPSYQHVDGTSFAAPIVAAVIAQMLEVDPTLTPQQIKLGLTETARPLPGVAKLLQGAGVVEPREAVQWVRKRLRNAT
ncbi:MAG: S8 family serine peptidase [Polyangiaceae bacterium]|nr:S8 family serine peptidase [Polyangiaceae bacterium]